MNLPLPIRILLWPLSAAWGIFTRLRARSYTRGWLQRRRLNGIVISVGNLTVGGTGKTPMVLWIAERLLAQGKRVAILSRGYRGSRGTSDEVELMRERLGTRVTFGVGENRFVEGKRLEEQGIDVFLLDDGFQHLQLARDLDIVLVDASRPERREWLLPAGRLREPRSALNRADLVVFTRMENQDLALLAMQRVAKFPIFPATTRLLGFRVHSGDGSLKTRAELGGDHFFAFCGIGNARAFFRDLERWGVVLAGSATFRDHHRYTTEDVERLERNAVRAGAKVLVTTEKDAQNLRQARFVRFPVFIAVIELAIPDEKQFLKVISAKLGARGAAA